VVLRPEFPAGPAETLSAESFCAELKRVDQAFRAHTGRGLDPIWRAPGGRTTPNALAAATACGYRHVGWSPAGFLGDELPSDRFPNDRLLAQALRGIRGGDILMAHLGIRSRQDPWAPTLDPLIADLKARGMCFATLREHPDHRR
jgi:peptidoglycan/xylan/chitin deacetylase (PgdA/CDA1 family)